VVVAHVFGARHRHEILDAVVGLVAVDVMNHDALWNWSVVVGPNNPVFALLAPAHVAGDVARAITKSGADLRKRLRKRRASMLASSRVIVAKPTTAAGRFAADMTPRRFRANALV
jgi:hypothetical protein